MGIGNRLLVVVDADVKGAIRQIDNLGTKAESSLGKAGSKVGGFAQGLKGLAAPAAVASAAIAAQAAFINSTVDAYTDYAAKVRAVQRVSGTTAEEASGLTYAFEKLGLGADKGSAAVFQLEKRVGSGQLKLADYGTTAKRTADGSLDLVGTLGNVADAYKAQNDPAKRAALVMAAFGRQGKDLIPILAKGRDGIKSLFDEANRTGKILDQGDLDRAKDFTLATRELGQTVDGLKIKFGNAFTPALTRLTEMGTELSQIGSATGVFDALAAGAGAWADALASPVTMLKSFTDEIGLTETKVDLNAAAQKQYNDALNKYNDALSDGNPKSREAVAAQQELLRTKKVLTAVESQYLTATGQTQAVQERLAATADTYKASVEGVTQAKEAERAGDANAIEAAKQLAEAYDKVTAAKEREAGALSNSIGSLLATENAQRRLNENLVKGAEQYTIQQDAVALADAKVAEYANTVQATTGHVLTNQEKLKLQRQALVDVAAQSPQTASALQPLIAKLEGLIAQSDVNIDVSANTGQANAALDGVIAKAYGLAGRTFRFAIDALFNPDGRAAGGPVNARTPYIVGEKGPEIFIPNGSGRILNARDSAAKIKAVGSSGGAPVYNIVVQSLVPTAATGDLIRESLRKSERRGVTTSSAAA